MSNQLYRLSRVGAQPRTQGSAYGQKSNTIRAWEITVATIQQNGGRASREQLVAAFARAGMAFGKYIPYFTTRCGWLTKEDQ